MSTTRYSLLDHLCLGVDQAIRALAHTPKTTGAPYPAAGFNEASLSSIERRQVAGLMRVNHAGEVCAQALYHAQGLVSRSPETRRQMQEAAIEEGDHLVWCHRRLQELGNRTSVLNPLWYAGSFCVGAVAGLCGDALSLGFLAETEKQVVKHIERHLEKCPDEDVKTKAILHQMAMDEAKHQEEAMQMGGQVLPGIVRHAMHLMSRVMVKTSYYL